MLVTFYTEEIAYGADGEEQVRPLRGDGGAKFERIGAITQRTSGAKGPGESLPGSAIRSASSLAEDVGVQGLGYPLVIHDYGNGGLLFYRDNTDPVLLTDEEVRGVRPWFLDNRGMFQPEHRRQ